MIQWKCKEFIWCQICLLSIIFSGDSGDDWGSDFDSEDEDEVGLSTMHTV